MPPNGFSYALFGIVLATDGGDTHVNLDRILDGKFSASDLRLRFEFGGSAAKMPLPTVHPIEDNVLLTFPDLDIHLKVPYAKFGDNKMYWESDKEENKIYYDVVLYHGRVRKFDLNLVQQAAVAGLVCIGSHKNLENSIETKHQDNIFSFKYGDLELKFPTKPSTQKELQDLVW